MRLCRRVLLATLASLLLVSSLYAQTLTAKVRRGNVRSGPGTTYDIVGTVKTGEKYKANASQGDWFKVLLETGQKGWVYKLLVDVSRKRSIGTVAGSPTESVSPHYGNSWAVVIGIDRYRAAPGLQYAVNDAKSVSAALPTQSPPREGATGHASRNGVG